MKHPIFKRPEFWIFLFFLLRMIGITHPPLEIGHNWRQVTGLMNARNFLEVDSNIFYPRIDEAGNGSGLVGLEFPLLNYLHYLVSLVFGYEHWYGRLINLIVSSIGSWYFFKLIRAYFNERTALYALLALLVSVWLPFSRKMMPDVFCISLMMVALWQLHVYLREGNAMRLVGYVLISGLAILSKIPAGIYFALLLPLYFVTPHKSRWWTASALSILPVGAALWWYFVWNPHLSELSGVWYNSGVPFSEGIKDVLGHPSEVLQKFYFSSFHSYVLFALFLGGIFYSIKAKAKVPLAILASVGAVFLVYIFKSGFYFYHHSYYIIPFVPVMAMIVALAVTKLPWKNVALGLLAVGMIEAIANQQHDFFLKESEVYKLQLKEIAAKHIPEGDLIAVNGNGNPQQLYFAHRKGWVIEDHWLLLDDYLPKLAQEGCDWLILNKTTSPQLPEGLTKVYEDEWYVVYAL